MLKRLLALITALCLITAVLPATAASSNKKQDEGNDTETPEIIAGNVYQEKSREDFDKNSPALYTCKLADPSSLFSARDVESKRLAYINSTSVELDVLYVGSTWAIIRYKNTIGYMKRDRIRLVTPVDPANTPPYGTQKAEYIATTAAACAVRKSMSSADESWVVLNPGTKLSIWKIQDGWAVVPYWRTYGYIDLNDLTDMIPVSPTDNAIDEETPIAAYTSYYTMEDTELNEGRITNIRVSCQRLTRVMQPGETLDFNKQVGPFRPANGYKKAIVFVDGGSAPGYGGGVCQVSATLYNALIQLPSVNLLQARPHGPHGAVYLPHGTDVSVGTDTLNFRFRNDYDFPIRIEGHTSDDGALLMVVYKVFE